MDIYNFFDAGDTDAEDNEDDFDEFLFQSIQRYNTLQMFNLENIPYHVFQLDNDSICVASKRVRNSSELLKLKLPAKLTLPPEEEGLNKENDFKVLSGIYIDNSIYQIGKCGLGNLILTSENNTAGLQIYSFTDSSLGNKNKMQKLDVIHWTNPDFIARAGVPHVICSKCCHYPLIQIDASVNKRIKDIKHPLYTLDVFSQEQSEKIDPCILNNIKCNSLSENLISVLSIHSGQVFLHDLRTKDIFSFLPVASEAHTSEIWTLSECNLVESSPDYFGILSNTKSFCIYDIRKSAILFQRKGDNPPVENHKNMKLKFSGKEGKFSLSGMNSFVEIFRMNENNFEPIFIHNGHCPNNMPYVFITDHIWLQMASKEYIVSICNNKTLHCWNVERQNCQYF